MSYYLIRPNADLQNLLKQNPDVLILPVLFQIEEAGYPVMTLIETLESYKLFYLATLHNYVQSPITVNEILDQMLLTEQTQIRQRDFYQMLPGNPPYTRQHFDRWWTIEHINWTLDYKWTLEHLPLSAIQALQENDSPGIAAWIERLVDWKKTQQQ